MHFPTEWPLLSVAAEGALLQRSQPEAHALTDSLAPGKGLQQLGLAEGHVALLLGSVGASLGTGWVNAGSGGSGGWAGWDSSAASSSISHCGSAMGVNFALSAGGELSQLGLAQGHVTPSLRLEQARLGIDWVNACSGIGWDSSAASFSIPHR